MSLLLLEAFGAMVILLLIVWWTMFSGRNKGELAPPLEDTETKAAEASADRITDQVSKLDR
jgi:hypothetical protein